MPSSSSCVSETPIEMVTLVDYDQRKDANRHDEPAELGLLAALRGESATEAETELGRRTAFLEDLRRRGCREIPQVREALASYRGERVPQLVRGDPTE